MPSRRDQIEVKPTPGGTGRRLSSKLCRAQPPPTQSSDIRPGTPARLSRTSTSTLAVSVRWWAPGASIGLPSVTIPDTRSGRRTARPRASIPPRLCPTIRTRLPRRSAIDSSRASSWAAAFEGAADVGVDVGAVGAEALAGAARRPSAAACRHRPGSPGTSTTGSPPRSAPGRRTAIRSGRVGPRATAARSARPRRRGCPRGARPRPPDGRSRPAGGTRPASGCSRVPTVRVDTAHFRGRGPAVYPTLATCC